MYFAKQMNLATFAIITNTKNFYNNEKDNKVYTDTYGTAIDPVRMQSGG